MPIEVPAEMIRPCPSCGWPTYPTYGGGTAHMPRRAFGFPRRKCGVRRGPIWRARNRWKAGKVAGHWNVRHCRRPDCRSWHHKGYHR